MFDLLYACLDHPRRVFGGLCHIKFGWNWCGSFDIMQVLIFCVLDLKISIQAPFAVFCGKNGETKTFIGLSL